LDEISRNDYNLNIPRYIDSADKADMQDLHAHLYGGGIPKSDIDDLGEFWSIFAQTKTKIFTSNGSLYSPNFVPSKLKATIQTSSEYIKFENEILSHFNNWHEENYLKSIKQKDHPKELIKTYGESLLKHFKETKLVSDYDIYQVFMDYVADTLSDDVYAIAQNGWLTARDLTPVEKGDKQTPNLILGSGRNVKKFISEIISPELVAKRYFAQILDQISLLEAQISKKQDEFTNFVDEFGEDELSNAYDDKDKMTIKSLKEAIKQTSDKNEQEIYNKALQILTNQKELESTLKAATGELNQKVFDKFKTLDENEIKTLVVDDKWLSNLKEQILSTVERAVQECITRISTLVARYDKTLDELTERANALSLRVKAHLEAMDKAR
jgi:type I restriction-modification system, M subunit